MEIMRSKERSWWKTKRSDHKSITQSTGHLASRPEGGPRERESPISSGEILRLFPEDHSEWRLQNSPGGGDPLVQQKQQHGLLIYGGPNCCRDFLLIVCYLWQVQSRHS